MIDVRRLSGKDEIRIANGTTVGKAYVDTPAKDMYTAEHSTLMFGMWFVTTDELRRASCLQLKCHNKKDGFYSVMQSSRPDWTGRGNMMDRDELMYFTMIFSDKAALKISQERLCGRASLQTSAFWAKVCTQIAIIEPELGARLVPSCVVRGYCKEGARCCGFVRTDAAADMREAYVGTNESLR